MLRTTCKWHGSVHLKIRFLKIPSKRAFKCIIFTCFSHLHANHSFQTAYLKAVSDARHFSKKSRTLVIIRHKSKYQLTGTRSGYFFLIFSPSARLFSKGCSSLYCHFMVYTDFVLNVLYSLVFSCWFLADG